MGRVKDEKLFQMIHDYIRVYLPNQRCSSRHTIRAYRMALDQLLEYTAAQKNLPYLKSPSICLILRWSVIILTGSLQKRDAVHPQGTIVLPVYVLFLDMHQQ